MNGKIANIYRLYMFMMMKTKREMLIEDLSGREMKSRSRNLMKSKMKAAGEEEEAKFIEK